MKISVLRGEISNLSVSALLVPVFDDENKRFDPYAASLDESLNGLMERLSKAGEITGKFKEFSVLHPEKSSISHLIVLGAGKRKDFSVDRFRSVVARGVRIARRLGVAALAVPAGSMISLEPERSGAAATEGALLGLYRFKKYKSDKPDKKDGLPGELFILTGDNEEEQALKKGIERGTVLSEAILLVRDLVNEPSNVMTPSYFAAEAEKVAKESKIEIQVFDKKEIEQLKMGAFLSVAQGSRELPKLIVLKYKGAPSSSYTLGLVGKGVTFDSGGISIKPAEDMHYMTSDMAGAATCLGALKAIAKLRVPINVISVIPLAENLPDGGAYKPGDIVRASNGKTIEIINTDAEGRLLLADALSYICTLKVNAVVDLATLTGAIVVALGHLASGVFSTDDDFLNHVMESSREADESFWHMPLFDGFGKMVKGAQADLKNSAGRWGGACTAAAFLKEFVGDIPWAHIDIAGTATVEGDKIPYAERSYFPKSGGTGVAVRTLTVLAERLSKMKA